MEDSKLSSGQIDHLIIGSIIATFAFGAWLGSLLFVKAIIEKLL